MHAEMVLDVFGERMHLEREVAAAHRVQEIEADGKLVAKPRVDRLAQQGARLVKHQVQGRDFKADIAEAEQQAVFFRHAIEAPAVVLRAAVQVADFLHPLAAPRRGIEEGHDAERPRDRVAQAAPHGVAFGQLRLARVVGVEDEIPFGDERALPAVAHAPVHEEGALVLQVGREFAVFDAQVAGLIAAEAELRLPARQVGINQDVAFSDEPGPNADHEDQAVLE